MFVTSDCIEYARDTFNHSFAYVRRAAGVGPLGGPPSTAVSSSGVGDSALPSPSSPTVPNFGDFSSTNAASISSLSHGCCVRTVCISPDCRHLAVGDRDGHLRLVDKR
ncbi:Mitogen-activated protein kinase-binding protein 1 [Fasciola gigantica]|uniref:Mitogen-activated protein kinase-binding protein 1 n=1 Tax=Fasciola gigantica TaxID=46835 RepID=A0A504YN20_FASGI|nr:Mitogen-activated protein kinase-binding protein 1 [Fasciola gigantica]